MSLEILLSVLVVITTGSSVVNGLDANAATKEGRGQLLNIIDLADRLGIFSFLLALDETNLTQTIRYADDITVFIPSNKAFLDLPESTREYWRANPQEYKKQMQYHIVQGLFPTELLVDELLLTTLDEPLLARFNIYNHTKMSDIATYQGSVVSSGNFSAANGIIHLIDQIVDRNRIQSISTINFLESNGTSFSKLSQVIEAARDSKPVKEALSRNNTLFAPNDDAFSKLPGGYFDKLIKDRLHCEALVLAHITQFGTYFTNGIIDGEIIPITGWKYNTTVSKNPEGIRFGNSNALKVNLATTNGVVHEIDTLLISPPEVELGVSQN
ncbi:hypothetical protein BV898_14942 [Hypsibius exemplaris]|uniref:FAS1 domain-containing protein n=1 Tax=Hypsibius exemplaris TaxID=2072580 RepID=A0A9X6NAG9_HYPEX|nr:hypothetical protein BV898_14942 [Hypsibius exemplaris]